MVRKKVGRSIKYTIFGVLRDIHQVNNGIVVHIRIILYVDMVHEKLLMTKSK